MKELARTWCCKLKPKARILRSRNDFCGLGTQRGLEAETGPQELCLWSFLVAGLRREFVAYVAAGANPKPRLFVVVLSKVE